MGNNGTVPEHGKCLDCAGLWVMTVAVPYHGKCSDCAGTWEIVE